MKTKAWSSENGVNANLSVPERGETGLGGWAARTSPARRRLWVSSLGFVLCVSCLPILGQFSLDPSTIDGGGGTSVSGTYALSGTIGQPAVGMMSGGQFTIQGGFWPGVIIPSTGEIPTLYIQFSGTSVIISWSPTTAGFALETTADLAKTEWTSAPTGNPLTVPITEPARFYRLKKP